MGILSFARPQESSCLKCNAVLSEESQRCNACGCSLEGVRLYNPRHFVWLAFLFSALVPIYLAASNWGGIGERRRKWKWLGAGFAAFALLFVLLMILMPGSGLIHTPAERTLALIVGYAVNLPIGYALREEQRPIYEAALRLGGQRGSLLKGLILGLGLVLCALLPAAAGRMVMYEHDLQRGASFFAQKRFDEAAAVFEGMLREDPEDEGAILNLALCDAARSRLSEAGERLEGYLGKNDKSAMAYALLAVIRAEQGKAEDAKSLASKARALDPGVFDALLGAGNEFSRGPVDTGRQGL